MYIRYIYIIMYIYRNINANKNQPGKFHSTPNVDTCPHVPILTRIAKDGLQQVHDGLWILWGNVVLTSWAVAFTSWAFEAWNHGPMGQREPPEAGRFRQEAPFTGGKLGSCYWSWRWSPEFDETGRTFLCTNQTQLMLQNDGQKFGLHFFSPSQTHSWSFWPSAKPSWAPPGTTIHQHECLSLGLTKPPLLM